MADENLIQIAPRMQCPGTMEIPAVKKDRPTGGDAEICGMDVGSTTCKYVLASPTGEVLSQAYERHNTKQAEKVLSGIAFSLLAPAQA